MDRQYKLALEGYISGAGEAGLQHAYELGRQAMAQGIGALELARIHEEVLLEFLDGVVAERVPRIVEAASAFFTESLASFEMTHLGFKEAIAILSTRSAELEALNKNLALEINERRRIESALRNSEERYRNLVDNARDVIYTLSPDGIITSLNPIFETLTGWNREEWIGKPFMPLVHEDDLDHAMEIFRSLLQGQTPPVFELRIRTKSGDFLIGEFTTTPQFQGSKAVGVLGVARDITERRRAEEQLRTSQLQLAEAQQIARLGNWEWNVITNRVAWSKELFRIYGVNEKTFIPTYEGFLQLIHPDDREHINRIVAKALKDHQPFDFYHRIVRPDGVARFLHGRGIVELDSKGHVSRMFGTGQDVTEVKLAEDALRELSNRILEAQEIERRRLALELHDDVCQRLSAMKLTIDVLENDLPGNKAVLWKIEAAKEQVDQIITDVRRISWNLRPAALDDLGLVVALRKLCKTLQETHKIDIRFRASRSIPKHLPANVEIALYRIAQESLSNAIKHAEASRIRVVLLNHDGKLQLTVSDNGKGFDASRQRRQGLGRGLGLLSMQERAHLIKAQLRIRSSSLEGTMVSTELTLNGHES
ncbi:MAG TPA: PAS domain S-box protein [Bacteroidota bacterium]|nr:PAS domain S-box protein [Bacteroidota bacterium]